VANHKSAEKRARQSLKRRDRNGAMRSRVRGAVKAVRTAIADGDADEARTRLRTAEGLLRRAASKGVLKKQTVGRSVSRLSRAVAKV